MLHRAQFQHHKAAQTMTGVRAAQHGMVAEILYSCDPRRWTSVDEQTDEQLAALICRALTGYLEPLDVACPPVAQWLSLVRDQIAGGIDEGELR
jgi:hypothetical protein